MVRTTVLVLKSFEVTFAVLTSIVLHLTLFLPANSQELATEGKISIHVVEGQNAINNISRNSAFEPVVEVQDDAKRPVAGASVSFVLPSIGPGGLFPDGSRTLMVQTDASGRAVARGLRPNNQVGQFEIRVVASFRGERATATITQTNAAPVATGTRSAKKWAILLGILGGGAAAAVAASAGGGGGGGSSPSSPPPSGEVPSGTITPGTPGFGPPR
jgi:hypothetical protein